VVIGGALLAAAVEFHRQGLPGVADFATVIGTVQLALVALMTWVKGRDQEPAPSLDATLKLVIHVEWLTDPDVRARVADWPSDLDAHPPNWDQLSKFLDIVTRGDPKVRRNVERPVYQVWQAAGRGSRHGVDAETIEWIDKVRMVADAQDDAKRGQKSVWILEGLERAIRDVMNQPTARPQTPAYDDRLRTEAHDVQDALHRVEKRRREAEQFRDEALVRAGQARRSAGLDDGIQQPSLPSADMATPENGQMALPEDLSRGTEMIVERINHILGEQEAILGRSIGNGNSGGSAKRERGAKRGRGIFLVLAGAFAAALAVSLAIVFVPGNSRANTPHTHPQTGPSPMAVLPGRVQSVAFSPNGAFVAAGTSTGVVREWNAGTRLQMDAMTDPHSDGVNDVAVSFDNALLATADANGKVYLWSGSRLTQTLADPSGSGVLSVAFSFNKQFLAIGDADGNVYVCPLTGDTCDGFRSPEIDPDSDGVTSLAFNPRSNALAAGDANAEIFLWIKTKNPGNTIADPSGSPIHSVTFTPDNKLVVAGDAGGGVYEWGYTSTGKQVTVGKHPVVSLTDPDSMGVESVCVSSDGQLVAAADANHHVYLWQGGTLLRSDEFADPSGTSVLSVAFDDLSSAESGHAGELLAIGDASGRVYLWPVPSDLGR
jgi:WD domain, G-beta repeat